MFGPVWTALYGAMGYASYRAWTIGTASIDPRKVDLAKVTCIFHHPCAAYSHDSQHGATLYTIQLVLNLAWTPLFFGVKKPVAASADIIALTGTVGYLAYLWGQVDETSGWLLAPYLAWLGFANYLCHGAGYLNGWDFSEKPKRN